MEYEGIYNKIPYGSTIHSFYGPPIPVTVNSSCKMTSNISEAAFFCTVTFSQMTRSPT